VVEYEVGGETYRFEGSTFSTGCPEIGEDFVLLVKNRDPARAVQAEGAGMTIAAIVLASVGALSLFFGVFGEAVPE
jgi:hypothetical protein